MSTMIQPQTPPQHYSNTHHIKNENCYKLTSANQVRTNADSNLTINGATTANIQKQTPKPTQRKKNHYIVHNDNIDKHIHHLCLRLRLKEAIALFNRVKGEGISLDEFNTYAHLLQACAYLRALYEGKQIHAQMIISGIQLNAFLGTKILNMYAKCGSLSYAQLFFDKMPERNVFSWNTLIGVYAREGYHEKVLELYHEMLVLGIEPDNFTFPSVLKACAGLGNLEQGREIHRYIDGCGIECDVFVGNALIDMYAKCGCIEDARQVFDKMPRRDSVSWNAMITGFTQKRDCGVKVPRFLREMVLAGIKVNSVTILSVLSGCSEFTNLQQGKEIHCFVVRRGFDMDLAVRNAIVGMYVRCGSVEYGHRMVERMPWTDVVSWTSLIIGYIEDGQSNMALKLFRHMQVMGMNPDSVTISSILPACASLAALKHGKEIHGYTFRYGFEANPFVESALIDMYAKCGSLENARQVFDTISQGDVVIWNAMIAGYGIHGYGNDAIRVFNKMRESGVKPNHITFTALLSACSYAGLLDEGWHYFNCIVQECDIRPTPEHYACIVDLLGRAGHLDDAHEFVKRMPIEPNASVWGALFAACRVNCKAKLEECEAECLVELYPRYAGNYVFLLKINAAAGRWDDIAKARALMKTRG